MPRSSQAKTNMQRTCLACRSVGSKRDFVRLVRTAGGLVEVDLAGTKEGRGAYLCSRAACLSQGLKKERIEKALRARLEPANIRQLEEELRGLNTVPRVARQSA